MGCYFFRCIWRVHIFSHSRNYFKFPHFLDALAPGVVIAQAIGRVGNWFNQEVFGKPTSLPWGLEIDLANRPDGYEKFSTFHPTFLYEAIWCLLVAYLLIKLPIFLGKLLRIREMYLHSMYAATHLAGCG